MNTDAPITDEELQAYADNELDPTRRLAVARHLEQNPEAAGKVEAIIAQTRLARAAAATLLDETVPRHLSVERLFGRKQTLRQNLWVVGNGLRYRAAAALVGAFIVGAASGWGLHGGTDAGGSRIRPLVEEAAETYAVYEPDRIHPVEIGAADREGLMSWVSSRLRRPISAPETLADFELLGGRVVATSRGPAAMFMYDNKHGSRIVMLICPLSLHNAAPMTDSSPDGLSGLSWSDEGIGYSLVGAVSRRELRDLGALAHRQMADKA
jgi:anti-sigma factor RsiW